MITYKVLIVDDDENICNLLRLYLEKEGFETVCAYDGKEALALFAKENPHMVLLDIMLPSLDGWQVCREIRKTSQCPLIMLTAKGETFDKVLGLELGADDYITKPFETKEVIARVRAVLRRTTPQENEIPQEVHFENLDINLENYELRVKGEVISTPPKELELLYFLANNPNKMFSRDQLLDEVWGFDYCGESRTIDVHIKRIREKIDGVSDKWELSTVWARGYKFVTYD